MNLKVGSPFFSAVPFSPSALLSFPLRLDDDGVISVSGCVGLDEDSDVVFFCTACSLGVPKEKVDVVAVLAPPPEDGKEKLALSPLKLAPRLLSLLLFFFFSAAFFLPSSSSVEELPLPLLPPPSLSFSFCASVGVPAGGLLRLVVGGAFPEGLERDPLLEGITGTYGVYESCVVCID